ncbi:hypothetical protein LTS18_005851, partial [Coniosporium uncinatum]
KQVQRRHRTRTVTDMTFRPWQIYLLVSLNSDQYQGNLANREAVPAQAHNEGNSHDEPALEPVQRKREREADLSDEEMADDVCENKSIRQEGNELIRQGEHPLPPKPPEPTDWVPPLRDLRPRDEPRAERLPNVYQFPVPRGGFIAIEEQENDMVVRISQDMDVVGKPLAQATEYTLVEAGSTSEEHTRRNSGGAITVVARRTLGRWLLMNS